MTVLDTSSLPVGQRPVRQGPVVPRQRAPKVGSTPVADGWACDNCDEDNSCRRRRCWDCGTSRY